MAKKNNWKSVTDVKKLQELLTFWNDNAEEYKKESEYYRVQLAKAHEILGRVTHQLSERWDSVNLTEYHPTDNLHHKRSVGNIEGN